MVEHGVLSTVGLFSLVVLLRVSAWYNAVGFKIIEHGGSELSARVDMSAKRKQKILHSLDKLGQLL
jgi:hypothetical protein